MGVNAASDVGQQANEELNFQSKMERVNKELRELTDKETSNDKVENIDKYLNSAFMDELLKNENEETFNTLKKTVNSLMNNPETARAGGEGLTRLDKFLGDIDNQDRMKGDYEEFKEKIKVPSKLNTMKSWEIRRLNLYLGSMEHKEDALEVYKEMKKIEGDFDGKKMKSEDEEFFGNVWKTLKNSYSTDPDFIDQDYPGVKVLENAPTADNLKRVVKDSEKWSGETETIEGVQSTVSEGNSIVDKNYVIDMVKKANTKRITNNENAVNEINIGVDNSKFTLEGNNLKYNGEDFTSDTMMKYFGDSIKVAAGKSGSFINDAERDKIVDTCKGTIFGNLKGKLKNELSNNGQEEIPENGKEAGNEWVMSDKDFNAMQQSLGDKMFIEKGEGGAVTYNTDKAKDYLSSLKDLEWNQLKLKYPTGEGRAWMSAVQILLNEEGGNKIKVDGKYGSETRNRIIAYQNKYNDGVSEGGAKLNPDGIPGKNTIRALLGEKPEAEVPTSKNEQPEAKIVKPKKVQETRDPESMGDQERFDFVKSNLGLQSTYLTPFKRSSYGLPIMGAGFLGGLFKRDGHKGYYYFDFKNNNIVFTPENMTTKTFFTQKLDINKFIETRDDKAWVRDYPPVFGGGKDYLQSLLDNNKPDRYTIDTFLPEIGIENGSYKIIFKDRNSNKHKIVLNKPFFTKGFFYNDENHLVNDLKAFHFVCQCLGKQTGWGGNFFVNDESKICFKRSGNGNIEIYGGEYLNLSNEKLNKLCDYINEFKHTFGI